MEENEKITCTYCGAIIEDENEMIEIDGNYYCSDDCAYNDDYTSCEICGDWVYADNAIVIGGHVYCSDSCAEDDGYRQCNNCGDWYDANNYGIIDAYGNNICESCAEDYSYCDNCCEYYPSSEVHYSDYHDECYCDNCYDELGGDNEPDNDIFFTYHNWDGYWKSLYTLEDLIETRNKYKNELAKIDSYRDKKDFIINHLLTIGFELETENTQETTGRIDYCQQLDNIFNGFVHFEEDGSLHNGVEIISQPFTLRYLREHENMIKEGLQKARDLGYTSHNNGRCGLHFHINRKYFGDNNNEDVNKLNLFFETYKDNVIKFSRRETFSYCHFISDEKHLTDLQRLSTKMLNYYKDDTRYYVVNNENSRTIEIRIMRGTLAFTTFMASAEFIFNLARVIENTDNINNISWHKVVDYTGTQYIKNYIKERDIRNTIKFLVDKSKTLEKVTRTENEEKINKLFDYIESFNNGYKVIDFDIVKQEIENFRQKLAHDILETKAYDDFKYNVNKLADIDYIMEQVTSTTNKLQAYKGDYYKNYSRNDLFETIQNDLSRICNYAYRLKNSINTNAIINDNLNELENYSNMRLCKVFA